MGSSADEQQFCLRWNNFQANITSQFETLRDDEDFTDVTIACEGQRLQAHKVVLSACSPYFKELFKTNPCSHPIIFMRDVEARHVVALMEFMYAGEVNVAQANLSAFLKTAESLKIRGLTDTPSEYQKEKGTIFLNPQLSSVNPSPPVLNNARARRSAPSGVIASPTACSSTVTSSQDNTTNGEENSNSAPATTTTTSTTKSNSQVTEVGNHGRTITETPPSKRLCKQLIEEELILDDVHSKTELIDENDEEEDVDEEVGAVVDLQAELDDVMHRAAHAYEGCSDGEKEGMLRDDIEPKVELPDYLSDDDRDEGVEYFTGGGLDMKSLAGGLEIHPHQSSNLNSKLNPSQEPIRQRRRRTSEQWFPYDMRCANNGATSPDILTRLQDCEDQPNRLVKLGEGIEIYEDQLRSVKWSDYRKLTRGLATILFSPAELATCSVTGQRWSRAGTGERPVKPALDRAKVQAIISYVATRFPLVEISRIKQVLAYKCKENSTAFKMKAVRYYGDQIRDPEQT